ncbi:hypothetical protein BDB01DRAFT_483879 [Pilobolus umbonatus]|nr:hypothetical protein BDB01DRAFT_483879 [Pilobolus umbonatus]
MTSVRKRPLKVVTDSEDDQSDSRYRRDLQITRKDQPTIHEEKEEKRRMKSDYSHTLPIHTLSKASVLSKEAPPENYSGFLRLGMLVLAASIIRLIIENYMKYGLLITIPNHSYIPWKDFGFSFMAWLCVPSCLMISFILEYSVSVTAVNAKDAKPDIKKKLMLMEKFVAIAHILHLTLLLTFPSYLAYTKIYHPLSKYSSV